MANYFCPGLWWLRVTLDHEKKESYANYYYFFDFGNINVAAFSNV